MRPHAIAAMLAVSFALVACGEKSNSPIKTTDNALRPGTTPNVSASAPPAQTDLTPAAPTPATHAQTAQPPASDTSTAPAPTARDTPAAAPAKEMSASEESRSMPKPGQTDNHFTPSMDGALKGTQQSPGKDVPQAAPAK